MSKMTQSQRENERRKKNVQTITNGSTFSVVRHDMLNSEEYFRLSHRAKSLLLDLIGLYNRKNNGDISAAYSDMKQRGWKSENTLRSAINDLLEARFIIITRQGGRNKICNLYALTFFPINDIRDKNNRLKIAVGETRSPPDYWKDEHKPKNDSAH